MYKKDLGRFIAGAIVIFIIVAGVGSFCVSSLRREASLMAKGTLPGLVYAGAANNFMDDNFVRTMNLVDLPDLKEQEAYLKQIEEISKQTESNLEKYRQLIYDQEDRKNFTALVDTRREYVKIRANFFDLVRHGQKEESANFFRSTVLPAYNSYSRAGDSLFNYNVRIGEKHGEKIIALSYVTPVIVGIFGVVIFIAGALIGFKATLP